MTNTAARLNARKAIVLGVAGAVLAVIAISLAVFSSTFGEPEVTGVYQVPGGELTVFADESARFVPSADALVAVDVPEEDQTSAVSECLLALGYRGTTSDGAERLYVLASDLEGCSTSA